LPGNVLQTKGTGTNFSQLTFAFSCCYCCRATRIPLWCISSQTSFAWQIKTIQLYFNWKLNKTSRIQKSSFKIRHMLLRRRWTLANCCLVAGFQR